MMWFSDRAIQVIDSNGEIEPFEPLELQVKLKGCFLASGLREQSFLSEDIALAVEYALQQVRRGDRPFVRSELNSTVLQILQNTGFPEVAGRYSEISECLHIECETQVEPIRAILKRFLLRDDAGCAELAAKVAAALSALKIANAPHTLILELARYYDGAAKSATRPISGEPPRILVPASELASDLHFSPELRELLNNGVVAFKSVSSVFPCVRLAVDLAKFAELRDLPRPLTEMELIPQLRRLAPLLDEACRGALERAILSGAGELPVCLTLANAQHFALDCLGAEWPRGRKLGKDFLKLAADLMTVPVSKLASAE